MRSWVRGALLATCCAVVVDCLIYSEDLLEDATGAGGSTVGGASAGGQGAGGAPGGGGAGTGAAGGALGENGEPCEGRSGCRSGFCVDQICCDQACDGSCESCGVVGSEGSCTPIPDGTDPDDECPGPDSCNGSGLCRCADGAVSGDESDVDCGGDCEPCTFGKSCNVPSDCESGDCDGGVCAPQCGDTMTEGGEECDDGNAEPYDGCSGSCRLPAEHLLLSELVVTPTEGEMIEIYNPTGTTVDLSDVYLADFDDYYLLTQGTHSPSSFDFLLEFPQGATIASGGFVVVALQSASAFTTEYGVAPDYDLDATDAGAPAMSGDFTGNTSLSNASEMVVLFTWNGTDALVADLDYVFWGSNTASAMNKTNVTVGGSTYLPETATSQQASASAPSSGSALHRCDTAEATETETGSNGVLGHDETSESFSTAFQTAGTRTPHAPPPAGLCP